MIRILDYDFSCTTIVLLLDATSRKFLCVKVWFDHMVPLVVWYGGGGRMYGKLPHPMERARARQPGDERLVASPGRSRYP